MSSDSSASASDQKRTLRRRLRQARRQLPVETAVLNAQAVAHALLSEPRVTDCRRIAGYLASDGELDLQPTLDNFTQVGIDVVLPALAPKEETDDESGAYEMSFRAFQHEAIDAGPYGLRQPDETCNVVAIEDIELVLMPLVGFDATGARLGMGGGYYDRVLAGQTALRIGVAHALQEVEALPVEAHDLTLHGVVTEQGLRWLVRV